MGTQTYGEMLEVVEQEIEQVNVRIRSVDEQIEVLRAEHGELVAKGKRLANVADAVRKLCDGGATQGKVAKPRAKPERKPERKPKGEPAPPPPAGGKMGKGQVLAFLQSRPGEWFLGAEIGVLLGSTSTYHYTVLKDLAKAGRVQSRKGPKGTAYQVPLVTGSVVRTSAAAKVDEAADRAIVKVACDVMQQGKVYTAASLMEAVAASCSKDRVQLSEGAERDIRRVLAARKDLFKVSGEGGARTFELRPEREGA